MPANLTDADLDAADRKPGQRKGIDWDAEVARARERGESLGQLAARVGVGTGTAHQAARRRGYRGHAPPQHKGIDWDAELARAVERRETPKALATRLGVSKIAVWRAR